MNIRYPLHHGITKIFLPDESYSISYIQHYFEYIIEKHKTIADNPTMQIHVKKNRKLYCF